MVSKYTIDTTLTDPQIGPFLSPESIKMPSGVLGELSLKGFSSGSDSKESVCSVGEPGSIPGREDPLKKEIATHSSILP